MAVSGVNSPTLNKQISTDKVSGSTPSTGSSPTGTSAADPGDISKLKQAWTELATAPAAAASERDPVEELKSKWEAAMAAFPTEPPGHGGPIIGPPVVPRGDGGGGGTPIPPPGGGGGGGGGGGRL